MSGEYVEGVVLHVVQVVAPQAVDGEHRAVAAPARTRSHCSPVTPAYSVGHPGRRLGQLAGDRRRVLLVVALRPPSRPGPSSRTTGRPRSSIRATRSAKSRCTSRTWQAYSSGDHMSAPGGRRRVGPPARAASAPRSSRIRSARSPRRPRGGVEAALGARAGQHPGPVLGVRLDAHGAQSAAAAAGGSWRWV